MTSSAISQSQSNLTEIRVFSSFQAFLFIKKIDLKALNLHHSSWPHFLFFIFEKSKKLEFEEKSRNTSMKKENVIRLDLNELDL